MTKPNFLKKKRKKNINKTVMNSDLILNSSSKSRFAESIKTIRTNLAFSEVNKKMQILLLTSPEPGDGKSFIAANLAIAYSQEGKKVLVIDGDLRKGRQHEIFGVMNITSGGYSNLILNYQDEETLKKALEEKNEVVIADSVKTIKRKSKRKENFDIEDYIIETAITNVDLIPNGPTPPNPVELLSSKNNANLLEQLRKMYDIIIIDCTPVVGISDASIMTKYSDANILVISNKKTKTEMLDRTKKIFQQANATITGVVINNVEVTNNSYYGYYCDKYYGEE